MEVVYGEPLVLRRRAAATYSFALTLPPSLVIRNKYCPHRRPPSSPPPPPPSPSYDSATISALGTEPVFSPSSPSASVTPSLNQN